MTDDEQPERPAAIHSIYTDRLSESPEQPAQPAPSSVDEAERVAAEAERRAAYTAIWQRYNNAGWLAVVALLAARRTLVKDGSFPEGDSDGVLNEVLHHALDSALAEEAPP